jgi:peptide/nickel transport system substrate-binding protein
MVVHSLTARLLPCGRIVTRERFGACRSETQRWQARRVAVQFLPQSRQRLATISVEWGVNMGIRAAALTALLGMAGVWAPPAQAQNPNTFIEIRSQDAPKYDPQHNTASGMGYPMYMMGDTLVSLDYDLKTVRPLLAKSWAVSEDGLTYTFNLRDDVTFCSGKKFTAADAIYTLKRLVDPATRAPFYFRAGLIDTLEAPDPYTLVYKLKSPHSELLIDLANFATTIINKNNVEALGPDFGVKGFDGTGPMCWESWEPRKDLVLKRHAAYKWGPPFYKNPGPVKYEKYIWRIVPEDSARVAAMLAGQADFSRWNPPWSIEQFKKMPTLQVVEAEAYFSLVYMGYKSTRENMSDPRVRKALSLTLDRNELSKAIYFGWAPPARQLVNEKALDSNPATRDVLTKYDPEQAKKLLDEAGWTMGDDGFRYKDGKRLSLLLYAYTVGQNPKLAEVFQAAVRKVGVEIAIQMWDPTIFFQKIAQQDYDIWALSVPYTSAGDLTYLYYHSKNRPQPNRMMWNDPETDRLLDAARAALTPEDRRAALYAVQERVTDAALMVPLIDERLAVVAKKSIKGVKAHGNYGSGTYKGLDLER